MKFRLYCWWRHNELPGSGAGRSFSFKREQRLSDGCLIMECLPVPFQELHGYDSLKGSLLETRSSLYVEECRFSYMKATLALGSLLYIELFFPFLEHYKLHELQLFCSWPNLPIKPIPPKPSHIQTRKTWLPPLWTTTQHPTVLPIKTGLPKRLYKKTYWSYWNWPKRFERPLSRKLPKTHLEG